MRAQLGVWREAGFTAHMDPERLRVYQLLAGEVAEVTPALNLDWRRALALHLWFVLIPQDHAALRFALTSLGLFVLMPRPDWK